MGKWGILKNSNISMETEKEPRIKFFDFKAFQNKMHIPSNVKIIFHMLFEVFHITSRLLYLYNSSTGPQTEILVS